MPTPALERGGKCLPSQAPQADSNKVLTIFHQFLIHLGARSLTNILSYDKLLMTIVNVLKNYTSK